MGLRDFVYEPREAFASPTIVKLQPNESWDRKSDVKWKRTAQDWKDTKEQLKLLEEKERMLREELILMANDRSCFGGGVELVKISKIGNVNYASIPELSTVDLEKYRKPSSEYWKLTAS